MIKFVILLSIARGLHGMRPSNIRTPSDTLDHKGLPSAPFAMLPTISEGSPEAIANGCNMDVDPFFAAVLRSHKFLIVGACSHSAIEEEDDRRVATDPCCIYLRHLWYVTSLPYRPGHDDKVVALYRRVLDEFAALLEKRRDEIPN